ncbi:MAG: acyl carrier protein [Christensenellaceae bacterium]|nr:acyl carrier protein [Christensenellaceae bacterium]
MEFEKVRDMIAEKMNMDPNEITPETSFQDIQIDSLDMVEIVMDLEDAFDVSIDTGDDIKTVADLVEYIKNAKA